MNDREARAITEVTTADFITRLNEENRIASARRNGTTNSTGQSSEIGDDNCAVLLRHLEGAASEAV